MQDNLTYNGHIQINGDKTASWHIGTMWAEQNKDGMYQFHHGVTNHHGIAASLEDAERAMNSCVGPLMSSGKSNCGKYHSYHQIQQPKMRHHQQSQEPTRIIRFFIEPINEILFPLDKVDASVVSLGYGNQLHRNRL